MSYFKRNPAFAEHALSGTIADLETETEMNFAPDDLRSPNQVFVSASGVYSIKPRPVGPNESLYIMMAGRCYNKVTGKQAAVGNCPGGAVAAVVTKVTGGGVPKWALPVGVLMLVGVGYFLLRGRRATPVKNPARRRRSTKKDHWKGQYYLSTYCNQGHRMSDGKPVHHECRILPVKALQAEWRGDFKAAQDIIAASKPRYMRRGVRK